MGRTKWPPVGTVLKMNAYNYPDKLGWQDKVGEYTFQEWDDRSCRFANGLKEVGVQY
jgi:non-ribosomal peptide synthetase component E (peptide arylation enzyme)